MRFAQAIPYCRLALQPPCPPRRFSCCRASAPSVTAFPSSQLLQGVASTALGVRRSLPPIAALYSFPAMAGRAQSTGLSAGLTLESEERRVGKDVVSTF